MNDNVILWEKGNMKIRIIQYEDGNIGVNAEDTAKGFGFTQIKNGIEYIKWERLNKYLNDLGFLQTVGKGAYISENMFFLLSTKVKNRKAQEFKKWFIPHLNKYKGVSTVVLNPIRKEIEFLDQLEQSLESFSIQGIRQYSILSYRIDFYIPSLNIAIEYDEDNHKHYTYEQHEGRQLEIENELGCKFIRVSDEKSYAWNIGYVIKKILDYKREKELRFFMDKNYTVSNKSELPF
jgi:very-short-patch-repair endonuclease